MHRGHARGGTRTQDGVRAPEHARAQLPLVSHGHVWGWGWGWGLAAEGPLLELHQGQASCRGPAARQQKVIQLEGRTWGWVLGTGHGNWAG